MNVAIDYSTVKWVKHDLDATLKQARQALEAYVENPADDSQLRFCAVHLHQVHGTLQMVELYGAALLAEEMEHVAEGLLDSAVGQKQEAYEILMRAILQLPDYLERLVSGGSDLPLVLLPLLNDLRALRGQKLLSENALFSPDLTLPLPLSARCSASAIGAVSAARKQRHAYQLALLGWFRGKDVRINLTRLNDALRELQGLCAQDAAQRLWWIAGGMVTAMREGWLDISMASKLLLGQVDRQIKRLMDEGEDSIANDPPLDLMKNLLFYIARANDGGEPVTLIKQTFKLNSLLPDSDELEQAQSSLSGHNAELMRTVAAAIKEDLARVKDSLDLFLRGGRKAVADLQSAADTLMRVADTLGMLGQGALRKRIQEQGQTTIDMVAGRREADEATLMDMASALLYVESSVEGLAEGLVNGEDSLVADINADVGTESASAVSMPESEFNQVRGVVADEAIRDIGQAKDAILAFMENSTDFSVLEKVPALFNQIKGGLLLLNEQGAAELVDAVRSYVREVMLERQEAPAEATLDALADVISSVEYYLENLREGSVFGHTILDVAKKSVVRLCSAEPAWNADEKANGAVGAFAVPTNEFDQPAGATLETLQLSGSDAFGGDETSLDSVDNAFLVEEMAVASTAPEDHAVFERPSIELTAGVEPFAGFSSDSGLSEQDDIIQFSISEVSTPDFPVVAADAFVSEVEAIELASATDVYALDMASEEAPISLDRKAEPKPLEPTTPVPVASTGPALPIISEDVDDEIREIFIEEADEELTKLNDVLPRWIANSEDREALADMRRSFHTLKGSGRLVGALRIGEFAWGYESMLNRLIDGTVERSDAMCVLLEHAPLALHELVEQIRRGVATTQPIELLTQYSQAVSRNESVDLSELRGEMVAAAVQPVEAMVTIDDGIGTVLTTAVDGTPVAAIGDQAEGAFGYAMTLDAEYPPGHDTARTIDGERAIEPEIDPVLYDIFCAESRDHLASLHKFLADCCTADAECHVSDELMRALHTLHGSARMVGADAIAELAFEIEKYGKALRNDKRPMSRDGMHLLEQAAHLIESVLPQLRQRDHVHLPVAELIVAVAALPRATANVEHIPSAEVPLDQDDGDQPMLGIGGAKSPSIAGVEGLADADAEAVIGAVEETAGEAIEPIDDLTIEDSIALIDAAAGGAASANFAFPGTDELTAEDEFAIDESDAFATASPLVDAEDDISIDLTSVGPAATGSSTLMEVVRSFPVAAPIATGDWVNVDYGDVDVDLLEVFLEEGDEILAAIDTTLQAWMQAPEDQALSAELQRHLHTLKGGARMANLSPIGDLSHAVESLLIAVCGGQVAPSQILFDTLLSVQDRVVHMLEAARAQGPMQAVEMLVERLELLRQGTPVTEVAEAAIDAIQPVAAVETAATPASFADAAADIVDEVPKGVGRVQQELVRVRADLLDNMVNFAGEISIYRSRLEQQVGSMRFNLGELGQTVMRLRDQLRQIEIETEAQVLFRYERDGGTGQEHFDPLEMDRYSHLQQLSRSMLEGIGDLVSIQGLLDNITRESETLLLQQSRVNTELQEGLMRTRMVPFSGLAPRMRRIVRQACQELGKRAELTLEGAEGEMDRTVIDRIIAPIEHMLRNAIAHGIESPEQRRAAGKRESGSLKVSLSRDGSEVVIKMSDDGAGINIDAIRRKAKERGLIDDGTDISDNDVMQFILETGFSTAEKVSQISGRGVGMDVVNSEVKQLGGSLHIDSIAGKGTTFTIRLPFTLAISQALLVQVHDEVYAIPLTGIEGIVRMSQDELTSYLADHSRRFEYAGHGYPVHNLGSLLGQGGAALGPSGVRRLPVLLVRSGEHRMALQVEALLGSRETVVKSVGPQISSVRGISGATILGDGRVVLILDLGGLLRTGGAVLHSERAPDLEAPQRRILTVMVVDDSITVRKVTTRLLERNDMQVITAKDGVDAVAKLQEQIPDVMLLDIEMPRMDGFELATHVRNEPRLRGIPMIMITSRTGDKHRKRAMEIGVDRYLGKPYQESDLLETIRGLVKEQRVNG